MFRRSAEHALNPSTETLNSEIQADVTQAAGETGAAANEVLTAAGELSRQAEHLRAEMDTFLVELRKVV